MMLTVRMIMARCKFQPGRDMATVRTTFFYHPIWDPSNSKVQFYSKNPFVLKVSSTGVVSGGRENTTRPPAEFCGVKWRPQKRRATSETGDSQRAALPKCPTTPVVPFPLSMVLGGWEKKNECSGGETPNMMGRFFDVS